MTTKTHVLTLKEPSIKEKSKRVTNILGAVKAFVKYVQANTGSSLQVNTATVLNQLTLNSMGENLTGFCHKAGITSSQLKSFIENNSHELGIMTGSENYSGLSSYTVDPGVTLHGSPNAQHLIQLNSRLYPVCNSCGNRTFAELPVCALCGHTIHLTEPTKSQVQARAQKTPKVIIDDGDVYVTEDDLAAAEKDLENFRKLSIEGCR